MALIKTWPPPYSSVCDISGLAVSRLITHVPPLYTSRVLWINVATALRVEITHTLVVAAEVPRNTISCQHNGIMQSPRLYVSMIQRLSRNIGLTLSGVLLQEMIYRNFSYEDAEQWVCTIAAFSTD